MEQDRMKFFAEALPTVLRLLLAILLGCLAFIAFDVYGGYVARQSSLSYLNNSANWLFSVLRFAIAGLVAMAVYGAGR